MLGHNPTRELLTDIHAGFPSHRGLFIAVLERCLTRVSLAEVLPVNKPQGIRDDRGSCCGPLRRSLGAMSKVATGNVGSRHSSTGSRNRHHEARSPARRPSGRLPSSLRTATAMRITNTTRTGEWFFNGSAVWPRGGFDSGCSFVAARLNQLQGRNAHVPSQPVSGK